jgi:hypothetical protein
MRTKCCVWASCALSRVGRAASMALVLLPALGVYSDSSASASAACVWAQENGTKVCQPVKTHENEVLCMGQLCPQQSGAGCVDGAGAAACLGGVFGQQRICLCSLCVGTGKWHKSMSACATHKNGMSCKCQLCPQQCGAGCINGAGAAACLGGVLGQQRTCLCSLWGQKRMHIHE